MTGRREQLAGWLLIAVSLVYLWTFVPRGWVPHDEGMLGQSAERVLLGQLPHVDYEEPYTGGLSLLHAAAFRMFGIDLLHLRWVLFAGAAIGQILLYTILKRFVPPVGAAFAATLALTWSFPNYFASLPSWWVLLSAIVCTWAFIRYAETESLRYAALAGLAAGAAILFKQTGVYVLAAMGMAFLYGRAPRLLRVVAALCGVGLAAAVLRSRLLGAEFLYLLLPIAACAGVLAGGSRQTPGAGLRDALRPAVIATSCAVLPLAFCAVPYALGGHLGTLLNGLFVLPQKRLQFASLPMVRPHYILAGVPCVLLVLPLAGRVRLTAAQTRFALAGLSLAAAGAIAASFDRFAAYQLFWQSGRGFAALLPVAASGALVFARRTDALDPPPEQRDDTTHRRILFAAIAMLAWASLVQFPFSGAIYFCYTAPLAVVAGAAAAARYSTLKNPALTAWCGALLAFAILTMNRGYLDNLGAWHQVIAHDGRLELSRAHLSVKAEEAAAYRRVTELVSAHLNDGELLAGPDSPEVYFLAGRVNPTGVLFDFFSGGLAGEDETARTGTRVVVLNHRPGFSPAPSEELAASIRGLFPHGESIGKFEVRWR